MQRGSGRPSGNTIRVEGWDGWAYTMRNSERLAWVEHLDNRVVENRYPQLKVWASSAREDNMAVGVLDTFATEGRRLWEELRLGKRE